MGFWENFKIISSKVFQFFLPLIQKFLQEGGPIILSLAFEIIPVIAMTHKGADGDAKRKEAFRQISERAKAQGIVISSSLINAAIELAVAKLKEKDSV